MNGLAHYLAVVGPYLQEYGYPAIFVGVLFESFGLPVPGESMLIVGAALASEGSMHLVPVLGAAWGAAVLGDNIAYAIGRFGGRRLVLRFGHRLGLTELRLAVVEGFFGRHGGKLVVVARFFELLRQLNGIVAGMAHMSWWRFLGYNALGAALWVGVWGYGVYEFGHDLPLLLPWVHRFGHVALAIGLIVLVAVAGYFYLGKQRRKG